MLLIETTYVEFYCNFLNTKIAMQLRPQFKTLEMMNMLS